ncbi:CidA/LrgA family protein [Thiosocius teredinicola]|uniref:CidA/LrgA family protein n=1 Tax=Thiosocius teredinicola TaxID=1973002 RepID=UPI000990C968
MNFINGLTILLVYQLVGEIAVRFFAVPVPGPVLGMLLLFATLLVRKSADASVDSASRGLLSHLSLLFVPAGVGMVAHLDRISDEWLSIALALVLSTGITMAVTAGVMLGISRLMHSRGRHDA